MNSATPVRTRSLEELAHAALDSSDHPHVGFENWMRDGVTCEPHNFDDSVLESARQVLEGMSQQEKKDVITNGEYSLAWFKVIEKIEAPDGARDFALGQIILAMFRLAEKRDDLDRQYSGD